MLYEKKMGLGCCGLTDENCGIIDAAMQCGICIFDTADCYGSHKSEIVLGKVLKSYPRGQFFLCTKVGVTMTASGFVLCGKPDYIRASCLASLKRLQMDYIDLYYLHRVDPKTPIEETVRALGQLVLEGYVKHIGLSEVTADQIRRAHRIHPIFAVQIEYSPWSRQDEDNGVIETCRELGIALVACSPLGRGFFTSVGAGFFDQLPQNDFRRLLPRYTENLDNNIKARKALESLAHAKSVSMAQLVLAWSIHKGCIPIPEALISQHLVENVQALAVSFTQSELQEMDALIDRCSFRGERYLSSETSGIYPEEPSLGSGL